MTKFVCDFNNGLTHRIALDSHGDGSTTPNDNQITEYVYGGTNSVDGPVARTDLLLKTVYPDGDEPALSFARYRSIQVFLCDTNLHPSGL
jgi:hypothetical protein